MKLYLDDERETPEGWKRCYTARECISILENGGVEELSLDHDLGDENVAGTGYDVVKWIEEAVFTRGYVPPRRIRLHTQNTTGKQNMRAGLRKIYAHLRGLQE